MMKARRSTSPTKTYKTTERGLEIIRDVKNEDRSGYVYENKEDGDKMSVEKHAIYTKMHGLPGN